MVGVEETKSVKYKSKKRSENIKKILTIVVLTAFALIILFPLVWMISTALKSDEELFKGFHLIPEAWKWSNFPKAWQAVPFTRYTLNTLFITILCMIGTILSSSLVAFGFSKMNFKGKRIIFPIVLATMMIPGSVTMIPTYILFARLHWVGSYLPLIVPAFFGSAFYIFLLRQFMMGIPNDYLEAAKIEGANDLKIYATIILPLVRPALISVAIFEFNAKWNDFLGPLLYITKDKMYTLQFGLRSFQSAHGTEWQLFMAASIIVLIPVVIIFFCLQRYFIEGVSMSGIK